MGTLDDSEEGGEGMMTFFRSRSKNRPAHLLISVSTFLRVLVGNKDVEVMVSGKAGEAGGCVGSGGGGSGGSKRQ